MKIQFLNGGLANQIFQYIFVRYAELSCPEAGPWFLDDSFFYVTRIHHGYELERVFGIHAGLLSHFFDPDVWDYMVRRKREEGRSIPQQLLESGIGLSMIAETDNWRQFNPFDGQVHRVPANDYHPEICQIPGDYYYHGYWINKEWFAAYREQLLSELRFPALRTRRNQEYLAEIRSVESAAVHIRCGDYLGTYFLEEDASYYHRSIEALLRAVPEAVLFVFTDDPGWCRAREEALGLSLTERVVYVEGNLNEDAWQDLVLMRHCRHMILSKSAFAYFAALTNEDLRFFSNPTRREIL